MVRTQIYLTEEERDGLNVLVEASGKKQSLLIREAVDDFIRRHSRLRSDEILDKAAGLWEVRDDLPDFDRMRSTWDRI